MRKLMAPPTLSLALDILRDDIFENLNCHAIGIIESFDTSEQLATVSFAYSRFNQNDYDSTEKDYKSLSSVPVVVLGGGKGSMRFPIAAGDSCLLLFNDRDYSGWFDSGTKGALLESSRKHNFSDAIAIVGLRPLSKIITDYSPDRTELVYDQTKISMKDKIKILNANASLFTILDGVLGVLAAFTSTNCVVGSPVVLSPSQVTQINNFKTQLAQLMEA